RPNTTTHTHPTRRSSDLKDGVPPQRGHTYTSKKVQRGLEPEEIFENIEKTKPFRVMVHQLHTTLHNVYVFIKHGGINNIQNIGRSEEHTSELQSRFDLVC